MSSSDHASGDKEQGNSAAPVAFGFSKTIAQRKVAVNIEEPKEKRQQITAFKGSKAVPVGGEPDDDEEKKKVYVVPKLENTFKTGVGRKFAPSFRPPENDVANLTGGEDRFELAQQDTRPSVTGYGLEKRARPGAAPEGAEGNGHAAAQPEDKPMLSHDELERLKYKQDMETLPDAPKTEVYDSMPVEEFGMAMLRGMGWKEGEGVGKSRRKVEPVEYLRRPERLGLGANPAALPGPSKPSVVKMGDKPEAPKEMMVLPPSADGRKRHVRTLDEQLVPLSSLGPRPGRTMRLVGGRHAGLACVVVELLPDDKDKGGRAVVRLLPSHESVEVLCSDLSEPTGAAGSEPGTGGGRSGGGGREGKDSRRDSERSGSRGADDKHSDRDRNRDRDRQGDRDRRDGRGDGSSKRDRDEVRNGRDGDRDRDSGRGEDRTGSGSRSRKEELSSERRRVSEDRRDKGWDRSPEAKRSKKSKERSRSVRSSSESEESEGEDLRPQDVWLRPYIKVRVVDKHVSGGRLYLKKGTVVDVQPGGRCDVALDDSREKSVNLRQHQLETVIPKEVGAAVMIVRGKLRGCKARLHAKSEAGACAVQLAHDFSVQRLMLDDVATYVGNMDED